MLRGARPLGLLIGSLAMVSCLRHGYDLLAGDESGSSGGVGATGTGGNGATVGKGGTAGTDSGGAGGDAGSAADAGADSGGSSGTAGTGGSGGTAGTAGSGGTGGVPPPLPGAPIAAFTLSPPAGDTATSFNADATASTDAEDMFSELVFDWDWESDATYDDTGSAPSHMYPAPGDYTVTLRVTDTDGNTGFATRSVSVVDPNDLILVTTGVDEDDNGATVAAPGGLGLSFREATNIANAQLGKQVITFDPGITVDIAFGLPVISDVVDIYGNGTAIDGSALGGLGPCLRLNGTVRVFDLEIFGCPGAPVLIQGGADNVVSGCTIHDNETPVQVLTGTGSVIGPGNQITGSLEAGLYVNSPDATITGNSIYGNADQAILTGGGATGLTVLGNLLVGGTYSIRMAGDGAQIWHNTMVGASDGGMELVNATSIDFRNNIVVNMGGYGIVGSDADFAQLTHNLFFGNASGDCNGCTPGTGTVTMDPLFVDPGSGDYRLGGGSPAINAGIDLGIDVNGGLPGNFSGSAPDIGYFESTE